MAAGLISGVVTFVKAVLLAALVFSGDLTGFLPEGIGIVLYTSMVIALICGLTSSMRGTAAFIQEHPVGVLALVRCTIGENVGRSDI